MEAKCPERGWPFYVGQRMRFAITKQSIINAATLSFTRLLSRPPPPPLSSKRSSGPVQYRTGNPRGGFPRVRGLPEYDSSFQPAGALSPGALRMQISPKLAPTDTPESLDDFRNPPTGYSRTALSAHSLPGIHSHLVYKNMSGLSRCYIIRAFIVLLFYA